MAFDSQGNLYATGQAAAVDFPRTIGPPHAGDVDAFVAKFKPTGELIWSRLLGGPNHDRTYGLAVAADDSYVLICGRAGPGLPTTSGVYQRTFAGDSNAGSVYGRQDGFAAEINADGSTRWVTYFGSSDDDIVRSCDLGAHGEVYLGWESGENHQAKGTPGAFRTTPCGSNTNHQDFGIAKLSSDGRQLLWFTYLCGNSGTVNASEGPHIRVQNLCTGGSKAGTRCALDTECPGGTCAAGRVYFKTPCWDSNFFLNNSNVQTLVNPVQGFQGTTGNTCLAVVSANGSTLEFSSFWSGASEIDGLNLLSDGSLAVCTIIRSDKTLLGASGHFQPNFAGGNADCAVAKIKVKAPTSVIASTYLGSNGWEGQCMCGLDTNDNFWLGANTDGTNWPITVIHQQATNAGGVQDAVATFLRSDLNSIGYSTYLGGDGDDQMRHAATRNGLYALGGSTTSTDFPVRNAVQSHQSNPTAAQGDAWVALFAATQPPTWTPKSGLPTPTRSQSPTPTTTRTPTAAPTNSPGRTATATPTGTRTRTAAPTTPVPATATTAATSTKSPTRTPNATATASPTATAASGGGAQSLLFYRLSTRATSVRYAHTAGSAVESTVQERMPTAGRAQNLTLWCVAAPGGTGKYTFTLRRNGTDTALSCAVSGAARTCESAAAVDYNAGDLLNLAAAPSGAPSAAPTCFGTLQLAGNDGTAATHDSVVAIGYAPPIGPNDGSFCGQASNGTWPMACGETDEARAVFLAPTAGTAQALSVHVDPSVGAGHAEIFTVHNSTRGLDVGLSCAVNAGEQTCADLTCTSNCTVTAGDRLVVRFNRMPPTPNESHARQIVLEISGASTWYMTGKTFTADTRYGTHYHALGRTTTEAAHRLPQPARIQDLFAYCSANPNVPATVTVRTGGDITSITDSPLRCTIPTNGVAACSDVSNVVDVPAKTYVQFSITSQGATDGGKWCTYAVAIGDQPAATPTRTPTPAASLADPGSEINRNARPSADNGDPSTSRRRGS